MIVNNEDGTLTIACDMCGIGCRSPLEGHLTPSDAYERARRHEWQADPYDDDLCPPCIIALKNAERFFAFPVRYVIGGKAA